MAIESVGVLPWLDIKKSITVGDVTFYPAAEASLLLGDRANVLSSRLGIYRDGWHGDPVHATVALHREQLAKGGDIPYVELRRATDILATAAFFNNDGVLCGQNATMFMLYVHRLGGAAGFMSAHIRGRNRGIVSGGATSMVSSRPIYAANFSSYNRQILRALVDASQRPAKDGWRLFDALAWFRRASTDAENIEPIVDMILMLTAIDFLLAHPGTSGPGLDLPRVKALLAPYETIPCVAVKLRNKTVLERSHIEAVLFVLNATRNAALHPRRLDSDGPFAFEQRQDPTFAWVADRCFMALLVARLVELGSLEADASMRAFIIGVERWIHSPIHEVGMMVLESKTEIGVRAHFLEMHEREVVNAPHDREPAELRRTWERDFWLAIGAVPDGWRFRVVWLTDGRSFVEIYERTSGGDVLREYWQFDLASDSPVRTAYSVLVWPENDAAPAREDRVLTDLDERAMQDPGLWLGGDSIPG
jgi:hypothetical protein